MSRPTNARVLSLALAIITAGCEAHGSHGRQGGVSPGAAVAVTAGALLLGLVEAATPPEPPPPPTTVVVHAPPAQAASPAPRPVQRALPGWVIATDPPIRVGAGVVVTVAGSSGVIIRLQTDRSGRFVVPMPLPDGRYTAFVDDGHLYGRLAFTIGDEPLAPLYLETSRQ